MKILIYIFAALLSLTSIPVFAQTWTAPSQTAPGGNIEAPFNVGSTAQTKIGGAIFNTGGATYGLLVPLGNVGIGTLTPAAKFQVVGNIRADGTISSNDGTANGGIFGLGTAANNVLSGNSLGTLLTINGAGYSSVVFPTNAGGGNVGIGTVAPGAKLEVAGQVKITGGTPGAGKVLTSDAVGLATWATPAAGNPGTITGVTAGTGLSGGGTTGTVTLNNTGVTSIVAGTNVTVSGATGAVTVNAASSAEADTLASVTTRGNSTTNGVTVGSLISNGTLTFGQANPTISAASYTTIPGGAYFSAGTVYTEAPIQARGGIHNDSAASLNLTGGTSGNTTVTGTMNTTGAITAPSYTVSGGGQFVAGNVAQNMKLKAGGAGATGVTGYDSNDAWKWQLYGDGTNYGFLNANWGGWDMMKTVGGALVLNGSQTVWTNSNLTNVSQLSNNSGYITSAGTAALSNGVNQYPNRNDSAWYQINWNNAAAGDKNLYSSNYVLLRSSAYGAIGFNGSAWYIEGNASYGLNSNTGFNAAGGLWDAGNRVCSGAVCSVGAISATNATLGTLYFTGVGGDSGQAAPGSDYRIYQSPGAWTYPYPDLNIAYHTGIKIGAYWNYGGTRFYNNSDMITELFSVGNGDNNVRAAYNIYAAGFFYSASDKTLKKDIAPLSNSLSKILKLEGVNFKWKDESKGTQTNIGVIAQDVEKVYPELVNTDKKTGLKSVQYSSLVAPLIEAIKDQQKQIDSLKEEVELLKSAK